MISRRQIIESQQEVVGDVNNLNGSERLRDPRNVKSNNGNQVRSNKMMMNNYIRERKEKIHKNSNKNYQDYKLINHQFNKPNEKFIDSDEDMRPPLPPPPPASHSAAQTGKFSNSNNIQISRRKYRPREEDVDFDDDEYDHEDDEENLELEDEEDQEENSLRHFDPYSIYGEEDEEEDVWYSEERLFEDHIQEIMDKWLAIDDEIWAKIICMERNRRIAKAYARKHSLTVNGSEDEYLDGTTLGLNSFENPDRDMKTKHIKQFIGQGIRIKIMQNGDILVKRISKANVFVHRLDQDKQTGVLETNERKLIKSNPNDLYTLNSDSAVELYGDLSTSSNSFSNYHKSKIIMGSKTNATPSKSFCPIITSDVSTSSSGNGKSISTSTSSKATSRDNNVKPSLFSKSSGLSSTNGRQKILSGEQSSHNSNNNNNEIKYSSIALEFSKAVKIFDMSKFKSNLARESRSVCPNRKKLQTECISIISFVLDDNKILNLPSWIMVINIVAIDLLKTELGQMEPFDYPIPSLIEDQVLGSTKLKHYQRFRPTDQNYAISRLNGPLSNSVMSKTQNSIVSNSHPMMIMMQRKPNHQSNFVSASKKAFANAAASGAYNHTDERVNRNLQQVYKDLPITSKLKIKNNLDNDKQEEEFEEVESDGELEVRRNELITGAGGKLLKQINGNKHNQNNNSNINNIENNNNNNVQTSSNSSSGFNSNCSNSHNDSSSSPGSSSSNLAGEQEENFSSSSDNNLNSQLLRQEKSSDLIDNNQPKEIKLTTSKSCFNLSSSKSISATSSAIKQSIETKSSRGTRPPKLPHRIGNKKQQQQQQQQQLQDDQIPIPVVSNPIPIPAPPASQVGGKANLILVSPTGLSPPLLPKRNHQNSKPMISKMMPHLNQMSNLDNSCGPSEFDTVKHIDEQGKCSVLLDKRLPAGIPAHAQLAPPATQRHILGYLMSANRKRFVAAANLHKQQQYMRPNNFKMNLYPPQPGQPLNNFQRPLPVLPNSQAICKQRINYKQMENQDENLYYCGLQARATNKTVPIQLNQPNALDRPQLPPPPPLSRSNFGGSNSAIEAIMAEYRESQLKLLQAAEKRLPSSKQNQQASNLLVTKMPLINKYFNKPSSSNNKQMATTRNFSNSLDELNLRSNKLSSSTSILGFPKLLKRSTNKNKKHLVVE